jgi:SAM-dependent methyltransferase
MLRLSIQPDLLPPAGERVLDVGCGDGLHLEAAVSRGCRALGLDYDAAELRKSRARIGEVDLIIGDATHLPLRPDTMAAVICTETLEHLHDDRSALREIVRVLAPGGKVHGAVPTHFTEQVYWALSWNYHHTPGGHVRIYRPRTLITALRAAGLRLERMRYMHFVDSLIWLRFCFADRLRRKPASAFEAAVLLAIAAEHEAPGWRVRLRNAMSRSWFLRTLDSLGACVWPKSLSFVASKRR